MFHRPKFEGQTTIPPAQGPVSGVSGPGFIAEADVMPERVQAAAPAQAMPAPVPPIFKTSKKVEDKSMSANEQQQDNPAQNRSVEIPGTASPFQRPGAMGSRVPPGNAYAPSASYQAPGSYSTGGLATSRPGLSGSSADGRRLTIGEGITLSGEIDACDVLVVEGTVEAALKGARVLEVTESGTFYGTVEIEECTIAGRFEGDITVNGCLTLRASGSITGSIAYKELAVEAGATLDGKITPLSAKGAAKAEKAGKGKKREMGNSNSGSELPFSSMDQIEAA